jgi:hypothetical protein
MFDKDRFKMLVHYACASVDDPSKLGAVKLNKIVWFSDVFAFQELGDSITGATYIKEKFGPIPQKKIVDFVVKNITDGFTAAGISELTHNDVWKLADIGEEIPMHSMLASDFGEVSEADTAWVLQQSKQREAA